MTPPIFNRASPNRPLLSLRGPFDSLADSFAQGDMSGRDAGSPKAAQKAGADGFLIVHPSLVSSSRVAERAPQSIVRPKRQAYVNVQPPNKRLNGTSVRGPSLVLSRRSVRALIVGPASRRPFRPLLVRGAPPRSLTTSNPRLAHSQMRCLGASLRWTIFAPFAMQPCDGMRWICAICGFSVRWCPIQHPASSI